jgi:hypothetical protein
MEERLNNQRLLKEHIRHRILGRTGDDRFNGGGQNDTNAAAVLFLLGMHPTLLHKSLPHNRRPSEHIFENEHVDYKL